MRHRSVRQLRLRTEGFTLVEMLIAVTLVALMALALWSVLRLTVTSWQHATASIDANQRHRATLDLVEKQLASVSALIPPPDPQLGLWQSPIFLGSETGVEFVSLCALRFRDNPGLTIVSYGVVQGSGGDYSLVERESRYLGGDPTEDAGLDQGEEPTVTIFDHLASAVFEYYDPGALDRPAQWVKEWDALDYGSLPAAIRISMIAREANGATQTRQVVVPISAEPENAQLNFVNPVGGGPGTGRGPGRRGRENDPRTKK